MKTKFAHELTPLQRSILEQHGQDVDALTRLLCARCRHNDGTAQRPECRSHLLPITLGGGHCPYYQKVSDSSPCSRCAEDPNICRGFPIQVARGQPCPCYREEEAH